MGKHGENYQKDCENLFSIKTEKMLILP